MHVDKLNYLHYNWWKLNLSKGDGMSFFPDNVLSKFSQRFQKIPYLKGMDFSGLELRLNPLSHVRLFHGELCNLHCRYCFTDAPSTIYGETRKSVMDSDPYKDSLVTVDTKLSVLEIIRNKFKTKTVLINGKGEPTLEPDFKDLVHGINSLGMTPVVVTNGTTLNSKIGCNWEFLYRENASIMLKKNSLNKNHEAWLFGLGTSESNFYGKVENSTNATTDAFKTFVSERRLAINCIISRYTLEDMGAPGVLRYCRETGAIPWFDRVIAAGRADVFWEVTDQEYKTLVEKFEKIEKEYGYDYKITEDMNFGCRPAANKNFFQITNHGRMLFSSGLGTTSDCRKRIVAGCDNCSCLSYCVNMNILDKLREYNVFCVAR